MQSHQYPQSSSSAAQSAPHGKTTIFLTSIGEPLVGPIEEGQIVTTQKIASEDISEEINSMSYSITDKCNNFAIYARRYPKISYTMQLQVQPEILFNKVKREEGGHNLCLTDNGKDFFEQLQAIINKSRETLVGVDNFPISPILVYSNNEDVNKELSCFEKNSPQLPQHSLNSADASKSFDPFSGFGHLIQQ